MLFTKKRLRLYLGGLCVLQLALLVRAIPYALQGVMDYRTFYTAGFMARIGLGPLLYDYTTEARLQEAIVTPSNNALPFISPAFTSIVFLPFSWTSYKTSFFLFFTLNLLLLATSFVVLRSHLGPLSNLWKPLPALLFATFLPVGVALVQGQLSLILLLAFSAAYSRLHRAQPLRAGLFLSLALVKFQVVLPVIALFLVWRRWRVVSGFLLGALPLALLSLVLTGPAAQGAYLRSLVSMSNKVSAATDQVRFGLYPTRMPNLYGFLHTLCPSESWSQGITLAASAALFLWATRQPASLPLATLVGLAMSYHLYLHDLSLLLLPICLVLSVSIQRISEPSNSLGLVDKLNRPAVYISIAFLLAPLGRLLIASDLIYLVALPVTFLALVLNGIGEIPASASPTSPVLRPNPLRTRT